MKSEKKKVEKSSKKIKKWRKPTLEEFKFSGCTLNGPSAS